MKQSNETTMNSLKRVAEEVFSLLFHGLTPAAKIRVATQSLSKLVEHSERSLAEVKDDSLRMAKLNVRYLETGEFNEDEFRGIMLASANRGVEEGKAADKSQEAETAFEAPNFTMPEVDIETFRSRRGDPASELMQTIFGHQRGETSPIELRNIDVGIFRTPFNKG